MTPTTTANKIPWLWPIIGAVVLCGLGWSVWHALHRGGDKDDEATKEKEPAATAEVQVAPLEHGSIERTLTAFGAAVPAPGGTRSLDFPFECRVVAVPVNVGQPVAAGDPVLQIEPSVDARLALDTARNAREAADQALKDAQVRFKSRLATNQDLATAETAARDARLKFESLAGRSPAGDGMVPAPVSGIVTKITAQPGAVVPAGGPLIEIAVENRFEARLGVAPSDAVEVKPGQTVRLASVGPRGDKARAPLEGKVRVVGRSVDPATRMVDAIVTLDAAAPEENRVLIGTFLRAEIVVEKKEALLAPRAAVLPKAEGAVGGALFTIKGGHAVKHEVQTGIDDGERVEIIGGEVLREGENVITQGNYELKEGMAVEIAKETPEEGDKSKEGKGGKADEEKRAGKAESAEKGSQAEPPAKPGKDAPEP
jgi:membrane fusion protein (multidrug efflux system)